MEFLMPHKMVDLSPEFFIGHYRRHYVLAFFSGGAVAGDRYKIKIRS